LIFIKKFKKQYHYFIPIISVKVSFLFVNYLSLNSFPAFFGSRWAYFNNKLFESHWCTIDW